MSSISTISSGVNSTQSSGFGGINQSLSALQTALQSGSLSGAQTAFTALLNNIQNLPQTASTNSGTAGANGSSGTTNPIQNDLSAVQAALQSGDVGTAQTAFTKLQSDLKSAIGHHGHHRHHGGGGGGLSAAITTTDQSSTSSTSSTSNSSSTTNSLATDLLDSIQTASSTDGSGSVNVLA